ncbi:Rne/Rng family ribonuclease [Prochlorothrix hollandica]|uniref:Rne/Rng family ribonuclease n=1 Tax=Prochlorothrix hollandica TaxID=1223 RepID=UPI00034BB720|nr:Rne/Rng family ribonuclease [Prochlorothrix hollandica]
MPKQIIIAEQQRIAAVFAEDQIEELVVAQGTHQIGDIYLGVVENVLPGIDAAFVNIGDSDRNGFIHVSDLGPLRLRRSAGAITDLLEPQQQVLVQVMKEPTGNKGPRLTGNITLPGRYLVLMPFRRGVNLSRRISSENERSRLRALAILVKPAGMGLLVRTEAEGVAEEAIIEDLEFLQGQWETVQQEQVNTRAPALMNRDDDFIQRVLRDVYNADVNRIVVDSVAGLKRVKQHLMNWGSGRIPLGLLIDQHRERTSIMEYFRVNAAIREALKPRVDLPSGGYIIIEPTEALTVVDVNSGSFTRSSTARETVLWTNFEAATEIARQLRLRNLAGVIVVDFIDMDARRDQLQVLKHFEEALKADKARPQIAQLSELGLVELTRKRQGQNIYEIFGRHCPTCGGLGHTIHLPGDPELDLSAEIEVRPRTTLPDVPSRTPVLPDVAPEPPKPSWPERRVVAEPDSRESRDLSETPDGDYGDGGSRRRRRRNGNEGTEGDGDSSSTLTLDTTPDLPAPIAPPILGNGSESRRPLRPEYGSANETPRFGARRGGRVPGKPPEVITVAMTEPEQEVYSWMGISPLVLSGQSVDNPRNVVIQIKSPNEVDPGATDLPSDTFDPRYPSEPSQGSETGSEPPSLSPTVAAAMMAGAWSAPEPRAAEVPSRSTPRPTQQPSIPKITAALNPLPVGTPTSAPLILPRVEPRGSGSLTDSGSLKETPVPKESSLPKPKPQAENRRRRRRSSATSGDGD